MKASILLAAIVGLGVSSCGSDAPDPEEERDPFFTEEEWAIIRDLSPIPELPRSPTNRFADDASCDRT